MKINKNIIVRVLVAIIGLAFFFGAFYIYVIKTIGLNGMRYSISILVPDMKGWFFVIYSTLIFTLVFYIAVIEFLKEKHHLD